MADDDLLAIGQYARLVGLSIGALRHYDETGVLAPASVDPSSGYRRYRRAQLDDGRLVALLRELEVPLEDVRGVLAEDDPAARREILARHRERVTSRVVRLQRVLHRLSHLVDPDQGHDHPSQEHAMTTTAASLADLDDDARRRLAASVFNQVWELLEKPGRTADDDARMVNAAHASRYLWDGVGEAKQAAIGDWQISRVYATVGRGEPAVHHARLALAEAEAAGLAWLTASAYEGLARAYAVAGDRAAAAEWKAKAVAGLDAIDDADDREIVEGDIATLPV